MPYTHGKHPAHAPHITSRQHAGASEKRMERVRFEDRLEAADWFAQYENGLRKGSDGHRLKTKDAFARLEELNSGSTLQARQRS